MLDTFAFSPVIKKWERRINPEERETSPSSFLSSSVRYNCMPQFFEVEGISYKTEKDISFWVFNTKSGYRYICYDFDEWFLGEGKTEYKAYIDWQRKFHEQYQAIRGLMDYELNDSQRRLRKAFSEYISKKTYNEINPLTGIETGKIIDICEKENGTSFLVEWVNTFRETVPQKWFPSLSRPLQRGDWFEAEIQRDFYSNRILKIGSVRKIDSLDEQIDDFDDF